MRSSDINRSQMFGTDQSFDTQYKTFQECHRLGSNIKQFWTQHKMFNFVEIEATPTPMII